MKFEFFKSPSHQANIKKEPLAVFSANGVLRFNAITTKKYKLKPGQLVVVGYDRKTKMFAIKFVKKTVEGCRILTSANRNKSANITVSIRKMLNYFSIKPVCSKRYYVDYDGRCRMLYLSLKGKK